MAEEFDSIRGLRTRLSKTPDAGAAIGSLVESALTRSNTNPSSNSYLWQDQTWTKAEAAHVSAMPDKHGGKFGDGRPPLWGIPISVKDCFDLAGSPTSCGTKFYRE